MRKPWLFIPAKWAHEISPYGLKVASLFCSTPTPVWNSFQFKNLFFKNRLGIAGGMDKDGDHLKDWENMGCGFLEMGTVTPLPQKPNPGPIIGRDIKTMSLWNKMGFPSAGADEAFYNLRNFKEHSTTPVFVNIGKNRATPNNEAPKDYIFLLERFKDLTDGFVVNISSPNTSGLRDLAQKDNLANFLRPIQKSRQELGLNTKPLLLKISPDLQTEELETVLQTACDFDFDGFILTNTTLSRENLDFYSKEGGVSGKPLQTLSKKALKTAVEVCKKQKEKKLIISAGGVMTAQDVFERIDMGADLVQVYSALVFEGPFFFRKVAEVVKRGKAQAEK